MHILPGGKRDLIAKAGSSIFLAVAISTVVAAFCIVAINFMWDQAKYNSRVQSAKEAARDILEQNITNAVTLEASYKALNKADNIISGQGSKTNSAVILDALPRKYDFPALRTSIDKLADLSGVKLTSFTGNDEETVAIAKMAQPVPQEIPFSMTIDGSYKQIVKFLKNLGNTIRPMKIVQLRLSGTDSAMSAAMDVKTYYQPTVDLVIGTRNIE